MLIQDVLQALKDGKKIARKAWGDVFIYFVENLEDDYKWLGGDVEYYTGLIAVKDNIEYYFDIRGIDLLADDWYVLDEA